MPMDTVETGRHCLNVVAAVDRIRLDFARNITPPDLLDHFWGLQDSLYRLVDSVTLEGDVKQCRSVIRKVIWVLAAPQALEWGRSIPAVKKSCEAINESLMVLERTTTRVEAAIGAYG